MGGGNARASLRRDRSLIGGRIHGSIGLLPLACVVVTALVIGSAYGQDPVPTPTVPSSPTTGVSINPLCFATEAYALEHLVAVIGEDVVPTNFDAVNGGGCQFGSPVSQITVTLTGEHGSQVAVIPLAMPVNEIVFPLPSNLDVPLIDPALPSGRYERTVTVGSGPTAALSGFEPVLLVDDLASPMALLLRAGSRWERSGITNYTYRAAWRCFCLPEYVALVDVQVVSGQVTGTEFGEAGFSGDVPSPQRFGAVTDLFAFIEDAFEQGAARVDVEYDPMLGYPTEVFVDYDERIIDEEQGFTVSTLVPG